MLESKFRTYGKLSLYSAIVTIFVTATFYVIDCIYVKDIYSPSLPFRCGLIAAALVMYAIYSKSDNYVVKRLLLALIPHMTFLCCFLSHLVTKNSGTISLSLMMLLFGLFASNFPLRLRDMVTSTITFGAEITLALVFLTPDHLLESVIFLYTSLIITAILSFSVDKNYQMQYEAEKQLRNLSVTDALTGCYNRKKATDLLISGTNRIKGRLPMSMLMLDIDHFKNVNDTYGHEMGDEVLKFIATTTRDCIRNEDYLFRWGGEEFVIVLINTKLKGAGKVAERIRRAIATENKNSVNHDIPITVSIGVAEYDGESFDLSLKKADELMYKAKTTGRNKVVMENIPVTD